MSDGEGAFHAGSPTDEPGAFGGPDGPRRPPSDRELQVAAHAALAAAQAAGRAGGGASGPPSRLKRAGAHVPSRPLQPPRPGHAPRRPGERVALIVTTNVMWNELLDSPVLHSAKTVLGSAPARAAVIEAKGLLAKIARTVQRYLVDPATRRHHRVARLGAAEAGASAPPADAESCTFHVHTRVSASVWAPLQLLLARASLVCGGSVELAQRMYHASLFDDFDDGDFGPDDAPVRGSFKLLDDAGNDDYEFDPQRARGCDEIRFYSPAAIEELLASADDGAGGFVLGRVFVSTHLRQPSAAASASAAPIASSSSAAAQQQQQDDGVDGEDEAVDERLDDVFNFDEADGEPIVGGDDAVGGGAQPGAAAAAAAAPSVAAPLSEDELRALEHSNRWAALLANEQVVPLERLNTARHRRDGAAGKLATIQALATELDIPFIHRQGAATLRAVAMRLGGISPRLVQCLGPARVELTAGLSDFAAIHERVRALGLVDFTRPRTVGVGTSASSSSSSVGAGASASASASASAASTSDAASSPEERAAAFRKATHPGLVFSYNWMTGMLGVKVRYVWFSRLSDSPAASAPGGGSSSSSGSSSSPSSRGATWARMPLATSIRVLTSTHLATPARLCKEVFARVLAARYREAAARAAREPAAATAFDAVTQTEGPLLCSIASQTDAEALGTDSAAAASFSAAAAATAPPATSVAGTKRARSPEVAAGEGTASVSAVPPMRAAGAASGAAAAAAAGSGVEPAARVRNPPVAAGALGSNITIMSPAQRDQWFRQRGGGPWRRR